MKAFDSVAAPKLKRNRFNMSHEVKLSTSMAKLTPTYMEEIIPGDTFSVNSTIFMRWAPMLAPVMHRVNVWTHSFFVPNRIVWSKWEAFIGGGKDGTANIQLPTFSFQDIVLACVKMSAPDNNVNLQAPMWQTPRGFKLKRFGTGGFFWDPRDYLCNGSLLDYMGLPTIPRSALDPYIKEDPDPDSDDIISVNWPGLTAAVGTEQFSMLPFFAHRCIQEEYFRDQTLSNEFPTQFSFEGNVFSQINDLIGSVPMATTYRTEEMFLQFFTLFNRAWEKDYFTSAMPFAQRGPEVELPGDLNMPDDLYVRSTISSDPSSETSFRPLGISPNSASRNFVALQSEPRQENSNKASLYVATSPLQFEPGTIRQLRILQHLQQWYERNLVGGSRYIEQLLSHFGVRSSDARLQRPEFLGGGRQPVTFSEVLQTSETSESSPLADMAGHGVSIGSQNSFKRFFEEHGYIITYMSVLPRTTYQQGVPRTLLRKNRFDYFWPEFQNVGEQEIYNKELFFEYGLSQQGYNNGVFGYQRRYAEYIYHPSRVSGDFRDSLDYWHLGRIFNNRPTLSEEFVTSYPSERIFNIIDPQYNKLYVMIYNRVIAKRKIQKYTRPGYCI